MCLLYSLWSILRYDLAVSDSERSDLFLIKQNFFCLNFHWIKRVKVKHIKFNLNFTYLAGKCSKFLTSITKFNLYKIVKMSDSYINTCWMRCTFFAIVYITISITYFDRSQWHLRSSGFDLACSASPCFWYQLDMVTISICCPIWCFQMSLLHFSIFVQTELLCTKSSCS